MTGCDSCGAQAPSGDRICLVCGAPLPGGHAAARAAIPVRRYGSMPMLSAEEQDVLLATVAQPSSELPRRQRSRGRGLAALLLVALAALAAAVLVAWRW